MIRSREIEIPEIGEYHARIILVSDSIPAKNQMNMRISLIDQTKKKREREKKKDKSLSSNETLRLRDSRC